MKFIIETEYEDEHLTALNGWKYRKVLCQLNEDMKRALDCDKSVDTDTWRDRLYEILSDNNVTLYD